MLSATVLEEDDADVFGKIAESKREPRKSVLLAQKPYVTERYTSYWEQRLSLGSIPASALALDAKEAAIHCYEHPTTVVYALQKRITERQPEDFQGLCVYCGGEADSFDHYLDKDTYPEFAVFGRNLIPSCTNCNRLKGNATPQIILNAYLEHLDAKVFLVADVAIEGTKAKVTFRIAPHPDIPEPRMNRIRLHYKRLELCERFAGIANGQIAEAKRSIVEVAREKRGPLLLKVASQLSGIYGVNYWRAVLFEALSKSDSFLAVVP